MSLPGKPIGTVVGNTNPDEFRFFMKSYAARLGDLVYVESDVPTGEDAGRVAEREKVTVWGRIVELARYNPFLPAEAGQELAEEGVLLQDTVLSLSRDQVEGKVLILGMTTEREPLRMRPPSYPVNPGAEILLPPPATVKAILTGDEDADRMRLGSLIGRPNIEVAIKTKAIVARHMAVLAMTGGGKTVAARRIIRELLNVGYPLLILDPHGDYLGLFTKRELFPGRVIKLFYPYLAVKQQNKDLVGYLISHMTQGLTDPQREMYDEALDGVSIPGDQTMDIIDFIGRLIQKLDEMRAAHKGTIPAVKRGLKIVSAHIETMEKSNERIRSQPGLSAFPFDPMPDPLTNPTAIVAPNQASILYLGGYDHLTQSTIVAVILEQLFNHRLSMSNRIPPFFTVVEEAHNFIPSRGENQAETPSVEVIRKVITEGRKFGTGLLLVSQRPSRLDETALSQCNTFLIFRLVNPRDQNFVERVMENLSKDDSRLLPGFGPGQGIVSGQGVRFPLIIQVDYDRDLETTSIGDENFLKAASDWLHSPEAEAARRSDEMIKDLEPD